MRTLIKNGTVVTATDSYAADVLDRGRARSSLIGLDLASKVGRGRPRPSTPRASTSCPAASTRTPTWTCRSAAPTSADDFETGTRAAATAARRPSSTSPSSRRAAAARRASTPGTPRPRARRAIDYAFHMIMRDVNTDIARPRWTQLVKHEGVTSFKLFMAYPGVFIVDDAADLPRHAARPARSARSSACTPRTARVIDVLDRAGARRRATPRRTTTR